MSTEGESAASVRHEARLARRLVALGCGGAIVATAMTAWSHGDAPPAVGVGRPGDRAKVSRTVQVQMSDDMRFTPQRIAVRQGETIRIVVRNVGKLRHEFILGDAADLAAHAEAMKSHPGMTHDAPDMMTLEPAGTREIVWQFGSGGDVGFACLQPGHFEAGMKGTFDISR
jgi:uncharacterized cupredoxin-like copper-binding protein